MDTTVVVTNSIPRRVVPTCYKCGVLGHISTRCPNDLLRAQLAAEREAHEKTKGDLKTREELALFLLERVLS